MTGLSLAFYFAFAGNIVSDWGLIFGKANARRLIEPRKALLLLLSAPLVALFHHASIRFALAPLGFEPLSPFVFALAAVAIYALISLARARLGKPPIGEQALRREAPAAVVIYACALAASQLSAKPATVMAAAVAAALGFIAASTLLEDIAARIELENPPEALRGAPLRFISAGLIALAFSGIDIALYARTLA